MSTRPVTTILDGRRPVLSNLNPIGHVFVVFAKIGYTWKVNKGNPRTAACIISDNIPASRCSFFYLKCAYCQDSAPDPAVTALPQVPSWLRVWRRVTKSDIAILRSPFLPSAYTDLSRNDRNMPYRVQIRQYLNACRRETSKLAASTSICRHQSSKVERIA